MKRDRKPSLATQYLDKAGQLLGSSSKTTNLVELILYAHLLLEHALNRKLAHKLKRPEILDDEGAGRLTFAQKLNLYVGLYDPHKVAEQHLRAFNKLRNTIAHNLTDPDAAVFRYLQLIPHSKRISAHNLVLVVFAVLLLHEFEAAAGGRKTFLKVFRSVRVVQERNSREAGALTAE